MRQALTCAFVVRMGSFPGPSLRIASCAHRSGDLRARRASSLPNAFSNSAMTTFSSPAAIVDGTRSRHFGTFTILRPIRCDRWRARVVPIYGNG